MSADGHHQTREVVIDGISSLDEPSVGWGWHQHSRKVGQIVGWAFVAFLLCLMVGNHRGHVEDIWVGIVALGLAAGLIGAARKSKDDTAKRNRVFEVPEDHYSLKSAPYEVTGDQIAR